MAKAKTLVLGMGNPILSDDAVGINVAKELKARLPGIDVIEWSQSGMAILEVVTGYDKLVVIDSIKTGKGQPGEVYKIDLEDIKPADEVATSHGVDIATAFKLGEKLGYPMPKQVGIYAVEIKDNTTFCEQCTDEVGGRIPSIVKQIIEEERL